MDIHDLNADAIDLKNIIKCLDDFVWHNASSTDISTESLSMLASLVKATLNMAGSHANNVETFTLEG